MAAGLWGGVFIMMGPRDLDLLTSIRILEVRH
jgi:hypothetical protein